MKRIKIVGIFLILMSIYSTKVIAASATLNVSEKEVEKGSEFKVEVSVKETAAWNIHVTSTGPVENCTINEADATSDARNTEKVFSTICKTTDVGTIQIKLVGDVTSETNGEAVDVEGEAIIIVNNKEDNTKTGTKTTNNNTTDSETDSPKTGTKTTNNNTADSKTDSPKTGTKTTNNNTADSKTDSPKTGIELPFIILGVLLLIIFSLKKVIKKYDAIF